VKKPETNTHTMDTGDMHACDKFDAHLAGIHVALDGGYVMTPEQRTALARIAQAYITDDYVLPADPAPAPEAADDVAPEDRPHAVALPLPYNRKVRLESHDGLSAGYTFIVLKCLPAYEDPSECRVNFAVAGDPDAHLRLDPNGFVDTGDERRHAHATFELTPARGDAGLFTLLSVGHRGHHDRGFLAMKPDGELYAEAHAANHKAHWRVVWAD
jgi:hypothetical protein